MAETGRIRQKRNNFSQVSNAPLRDKTLSLRAKGLYSLIQSYITLDTPLYKTWIMKMCTEGRDAFNKVWKELLDSGYLVMYKLQDKNGRYYYEYELLDEKPLGNKESEPHTENPHMVENPPTENPCVVEPHVENPGYGGTVPIYNTNNNTDYSNTNYCNKEQQLLVVDDPLSRCIQAYVDNFGNKPNPAECKDMKRSIDELSEYDVIYAIRVAATKGKEYDYAIGVMRNLWKEKYSCDL